MSSRGPNFGGLCPHYMRAEAKDVIQFSKDVFADFNAVHSHMAQVGTSVVITLDDHNSVEIQHTTVDMLGSDHFWFV